MIPKLSEKNKAIKLRKSGATYSEVLKEVSVAKSTLSLWLRDVGMSKAQKQIFTEKRRLAQLKGAKARKTQRIELSEKIFSQSEKEVGTITPREFWLIGVMLYWGEGSKEKEARPGSGMDFTNSDPYMLKLFVCWLFKIFKLTGDNLVFEIYIHKIYMGRIDQIKKYWSDSLGFPVSKFTRVYLKRHTIKTSRKNVGSVYNGNIRIRVRASSTMLRKITGWTRGIYKSGIAGSSK